MTILCDYKAPASLKYDADQPAHSASYPPSTNGSLDPNEAVANQILDLVTQAKDFGGAALLNLQTRELPSGHFIVEGDAAR